MATQQGWSQQTPAIINTIRSAFGATRRSGARRRKRKAAKSTTRRKKSSRKAKRPARMVKGSLAARRYMASIRKKRK